jgi:hypothetical protein
LNPRLVFCLFGALFAGLLAGVVAVVAGWGLLAGLLLYSGTGSTMLLLLSIGLPQRMPALDAASGADEPALA